MFSEGFDTGNVDCDRDALLQKLNLQDELLTALVPHDLSAQPGEGPANDPSQTAVLKSLLARQRFAGHDHAHGHDHQHEAQRTRMPHLLELAHVLRHLGAPTRAEGQQHHLAKQRLLLAERHQLVATRAGDDALRVAHLAVEGRHGAHRERPDRAVRDPVGALVLLV